MSSVANLLESIGIDVEDFHWKDLALCSSMPTNMFYDDYESDPQVAQVVDEACLSCPVMSQCLLSGMENSEWGVWGGIYLASGKQDENKNAHKSQDTWDTIRRNLGG